MADSILTSTKAMLGLAEDHTAFDTELVLFINSVLGDLTQLGVGPKEGFMIEDKYTDWNELLEDDLRLNMVLGYMQQRVKLQFDPPDVGFVLTAMKEQIEKAEFRIKTAAEEDAIDEAYVEPVRVPTPNPEEWIYYGN